MRARIMGLGAGLAAMLGITAPVHAADLDLARASLLAVADGEGTTRIAAELLARDLTALGGRPGPIVADRANCIDMCVVIGTIASPVVQRLARRAGWTCRRSRAAGNAMSGPGSAWLGGAIC